MCLGIPVKIVEINENKGTAEFAGLRRDIHLDLLEDVRIGDYVILHAGFAIQRLNEEEAEETLKILKEITLNEVSG